MFLERRKSEGGGSLVDDAWMLSKVEVICDTYSTLCTSPHVSRVEGVDSSVPQPAASKHGMNKVLLGWERFAP